ncbi:hypothetical protein [Paraflavitalea speifideaquila]|uniref:hypothetical protein n=1 Tax=Paraflavitalea speifideaquila TaxID=3076558 RepID=UPI0028EFC69C|nr:hypothetical protein [Paraflavitalea speifideiaquila]
MFKNPGYIVVALGMMGVAFSLSYSVTWIPQALCLVLSLCVVGAGIYLMAKRSLLGTSDSHLSRLLQIEQLQKTGENIKITLDNCEVKSRSWQQEIVNDDMPGRVEMWDGVLAQDRNHKTVAILQTYIVFQKKYRGQTYKFISQPTLQSDVALKMHIDEGQVGLYIDKKNPSHYYFDWGCKNRRLKYL